MESMMKRGNYLPFYEKETSRGRGCCFEAARSYELLILTTIPPDGTGEIVGRLAKDNPRLHLIRRPGKMGLGTAYITGFKYALKNGYDYIFEMDADSPTIPMTCAFAGSCQRQRFGHRLTLLQRHQHHQLAYRTPDDKLLCLQVRAHHHRHAGPRPHRRVQMFQPQGAGKDGFGQSAPRVTPSR